MRFLYEDSNMISFAFPDNDNGKEFLVIIYKKHFSDTKGSFRRAVGSFFLDGVERDVEAGSYIYDKCKDWVDGK